MCKLVSVMSLVLFLLVMIMGCIELKMIDFVQEIIFLISQQNILISEKVEVQDEQKVLDMFLEYKKIELIVDYVDYEDILIVEGLLVKGEMMKLFLMEKNYEFYMVNWYVMLFLMVVDKEKVLFYLENIFVEIKESKNDWIFVEYSLNLVFIDCEGKQLKNILLLGDIIFLQD